MDSLVSETSRAQNLFEGMVARLQARGQSRVAIVRSYGCARLVRRLEPCKTTAPRLANAL